MPPAIQDLNSFTQHLSSARRILALIGAGLSASSGLPTFRGAGGLWNGYDATQVATLDAFQSDPALVWQFYASRRASALKAKPNKGHYALAELAQRLGPEKFLALTQNVDGLSARANHPQQSLLNIHGDLFSVKCTSFMCNYSQDNYFDNPITPGLSHCVNSNEIREIPIEDLPHCPKCKTGLLRPGVVWFGETLPLKAVQTADDFVESGEVDLILVIGTSGTVWPAAGYIDRVSNLGGKVAVFNTEISEDSFTDDIWSFEGDAAESLPTALEPIIGTIKPPR